MQYRAFKIKELDEPYQWTFKNTSGVMKTFTNYDTLAYAAGGAVSKWSIDDDYLLSNNSTATITAPTKAVPGQIIALIDDAGTKAFGMITGVDNDNLQITFRSVLSFFDIDILNPMRELAAQEEDDVKIKYMYDGVEDTALMLAAIFSSAGTDKYRRLPVRIRTSGGGKTDGAYNVPAIWKYTDNTFNCKEWLQALFDTHNVVVQCKLVFEVSRAFIEIYVAHNMRGGRMVKNNIHAMIITHNEDSAAKATVCQVIDKESKALLSTWFLLNNNTVSEDASATNRVQPYKLTVAEFDSDNTDDATEQSIAEDNLLYSDLNHYVKCEFDRESAMYPKNLNIGDSVTIVPKLEEMSDDKALTNEYADKILKSIYTGKKEDSDNSMVTLIFGKIRINYTDIIQMRYQRKARD